MVYKPILKVWADYALNNSFEYNTTVKKVIIGSGLIRNLLRVFEKLLSIKTDYFANNCFQIVTLVDANQHFLQMTNYFRVALQMCTVEVDGC